MKIAKLGKQWRLLFAAGALTAGVGWKVPSSVESVRHVPGYQVVAPCDTMFTATGWREPRLPFIVGAATNSEGRILVLDARASGVRFIQSGQKQLGRATDEHIDFGRPLVGSSVLGTGKPYFVLALLGMRIVLVDSAGRVIGRYSLRPSDKSAGSASPAGLIGDRRQLAVTTAKLEHGDGGARRRISTLRLFDSAGREVDAAREIKGVPFMPLPQTEGRITGNAPSRRTTAVTSQGRIFQLDEQANVLRIFDAKLVQMETVSLSGAQGWKPPAAQARDPLAMLGDAAGNAWVEVPSHGTAQRTWLVFGGANTSVTPAATPAGESVLEIGIDRVILVRNDELGSRSLRVCRIARHQ